jgi:predicted nucleotidyltransferase
MNTAEQLFRVAKSFGNGAHVFVPKEWLGEQLIVIKPQKKSLKERILETLQLYLEDIIGIYLYGSQARNEAREDSDIDLLIITNKSLHIRKEGFEITCIEEKHIAKTIALEPILMYALLAEAKPILNSALLEHIQNTYTPKRKDFSEFFSDVKRIIAVNEEFLEKEQKNYVSGEASIYSLMLRLRGIFLITCLLSKKGYTHQRFISWIRKHLPHIDVETIYEAYRYSKMDKPVTQKIRVEDLKELLLFLKKQLNLIRHD